jgi:hypothetical protein
MTGYADKQATSYPCFVFVNDPRDLLQTEERNQPMLPSDFDRLVELNRGRHAELLSAAKKVRLLRQPTRSRLFAQANFVKAWWRLVVTAILPPLERATVQWLAQNYQRHTVRRAVSQAYRIFAHHHPQETAALFDEYFVRTHLLPLLQRAATTGEKVTPVQVAELWARQVSVLFTSRQQHIACTIPTATHFLSILADALAQTHVGQNLPLLVETAVD